MEILRSEDPRRLGRFRLLSRIGAGGFGEVFLGQEEPGGRGRFAAVKIIRTDVAESERLRPRFHSEIEAVDRAGGEGIPELLDADPAARRPWLATRYVPGPSLQRLVDEAGPLPQTTVLALGRRLAGTLAALHGAGLYHRDLKPSNVLVTPARPWIIDFSLVRLVANPSLTVTADAMGSFQYAAPEQASGLGRARGPADVFAFAATLLFAATGHPPYNGRNQFDIRLRALTEPPDITGLRDGPLRELVTACLRFTDTERPSMNDVRAGLAHAADADHIPYPPTALHVFGRHTDELRALIGPRADQLAREETGERETRRARGREAGREQWSPGNRTDDGLAPTVPAFVPVPAPVPVPVPAPASVPASEWAQASAAEPAPEPATGERWVWHCHDWLRVPPWLMGDMVLIATAGGVLYGVEYRSGRPLWRLDLGAPVRGGPVPVRDGVVLGAADGAVHHVRPAAAGPEHARHRFSAGVHTVGRSGAPGDDPDRLFVAEGRSVRVLDLRSGDCGWAVEDAGVVTGRAVVAVGTVVYRTDRGQVVCRRMDDGSRLWDVHPRAAGPAGVTALEDAVVVPGADGTVTALCRATGETVWAAPAGGTVHLAAVGCDGAVVVATTEGSVTALGAEDGHPLWTAPATGGAAPRALDVLVDGSAVCVADQRGIRLLAVDDGRLLRRWELSSVSGLRPAEDGLIAVGLDGAVRRLALGGRRRPATD
ncbi:PQQ-binding-like beta-propeller repeat protein [Streptomyces pratens]|uniref:PQQ-binding-like beta-propeller repeat protein n=1 Tax=Streptomyces pratens TaxID=887456 RepID=A0ABW1LS36_9ACTN